jgi:hypothetical protein
MEGGLPLQALAHPPTAKEKKKIVGVFQQNHLRQTGKIAGDFMARSSTLAPRYAL